VRNCKFCIVHEKEGEIRAVEPKNINPKGKYVKVQDNNFFASPNWKKAIWKLWEHGQPVEFLGIDVRSLTVDMCKCLKYTNHYKQLKTAWDTPRENIVPDIKRLLRTIKAWRIMCYVLIGYWSTEAEDLRRVLTLQKMGIDPFVMPYNKSDPDQRRFARWVNHKAIFKSVKWKNYK